MSEEGIRSEGSWSEGGHAGYEGLFTTEMGTVRGGLVTDMPAAGRPMYSPSHVKGVAGATPTDNEDYPEGSTWRPV